MQQKFEHIIHFVNFLAVFFCSESPVDKSLQRRFSSSKLLAKKPNLTTLPLNERTEEDVLDDDAFEHILQVTSDHEAIMAYYYMDENNKVRIIRTLDALNRFHCLKANICLVCVVSTVY